MATITNVDPFDEAAFPYCVVPDEVMGVFERYDMTVDDFQRNGHVLSFYVIGHTDSGGEMFHTLYLNDDELDNVPSWREAAYGVLNDFDPWKEAFMWCDQFGVPQRTPFDNGADLYEDIRNYRNDVLQAVYDDLMEL